ncbi:MAG: hypothetical protein HY827_02690 [Actinobacteria bacterium]|nr:hypothetical protein [Actinomycetota bacterium]
MNALFEIAPTAFNYIDWLPLTELFVFLKIFLLPAALIGWFFGRIRERRGGLKAHESAVDKTTRHPIWTNHSLQSDDAHNQAGE